MKKRLCWFVLGWLFSGPIGVLTAAPLRVLYFTKSSGFEHSVVKREKGDSSYSEKILEQLGAAHEIEFTPSKDGSLFTPEYLAGFDVFLFYTSGDLLSAGTDGQPPLTVAGKKALLDAVAAGKGFVGLHSCSDTFHAGESGGGIPEPSHPNRHKNLGEDADPFTKMLGGEFISHGAEQVATARVISRDFPGLETLPAEIVTKEEWYSLKEFPPDLHVLLLLQTQGMKGNDYRRPPYPIAWVRSHGRGRVAYNAMGHREDVWDSQAFQTILLSTLKWAGQRSETDIGSNLATIAPECMTLPPAPAAKPGK